MISLPRRRRQQRQQRHQESRDQEANTTKNNNNNWFEYIIIIITVDKKRRPAVDNFCQRRALKIAAPRKVHWGVVEIIHSKVIIALAIPMIMRDLWSW